VESYPVSAVLVSKYSGKESANLKQNALQKHPQLRLGFSARGQNRAGRNYLAEDWDSNPSFLTRNASTPE
jgi:hypothetical protein